MANLKRKSPSANSLVVFDVTSQHLSFSRAAEDLGTTRVAVSNQVRALEEHLNVRLFERVHRGLRLTAAGALLAESVARSFKDIAIALDRVAAAAGKNQLAISASQGMSSHWLMPRIHRFRDAFPDADIRFQVIDSYVDLAAEGIDVALRYGDGPWKGVRAKRLTQVRRFPVCSPEYLKTRSRPRSPADLTEHALLYLSGRYGRLTRWDEWLREVGCEVPSIRRGLTFDDHNSLIEAALAGQGVALAGPPQISHYLASGQLLRLFDKVETRHRFFWIVEPDAAPRQPLAAAFAAWLEQEMQASLHDGRDGAAPD
ncbi:MAG: LysR substrate-binding domain-containing protein [Pseudomonadota bacterium]